MGLFFGIVPKIFYLKQLTDPANRSIDREMQWYGQVRFDLPIGQMLGNQCMHAGVADVFGELTRDQFTNFIYILYPATNTRRWSVHISEIHNVFLLWQFRTRHARVLPIV